MQSAGPQAAALPPTPHPLNQSKASGILRASFGEGARSSSFNQGQLSLLSGISVLSYVILLIPWLILQYKCVQWPEAELLFRWPRQKGKRSISQNEKDEGELRQRFILQLNLLVRGPEYFFFSFLSAFSAHCLVLG